MEYDEVREWIFVFGKLLGIIGFEKSFFSGILRGR